MRPDFLTDGNRFNELLSTLKKLPRIKVSVDDVSTGREISVECRVIHLAALMRLQFAHELSLEEPMVLGSFKGVPFRVCFRLILTLMVVSVFQFTYLSVRL